MTMSIRKVMVILRSDDDDDDDDDGDDDDDDFLPGRPGGVARRIETFRN